MYAYALVVVIEAPDAEQAYDAVSSMVGNLDETQFVSEPWPVEPTNADELAALARLRATHGDARLDSVDISPTYSTLEAFDQHPER